MMQHLLAEMEKRNLDSLYISGSTNMNYVSHFNNGDAYLLITPNEYFMLTDPRYTEQASYECPEYTILNWRDFGSIGGCLAAIAEKKNLRAMGYESNHLTMSEYLDIQSRVKAELVPTTDIIETFRMIKKPEEIECLKISCQIACRAFEKIQKDIRVGISEKELAARLNLHMVMEGADTNPYGKILISGAKTSLLHGKPSDKLIEKGDLVLMDYGCQYHGYLSDMTRTVVVGKATEKQKEVYRLEYEMVEEMEKALKPGATSLSVYEAGTKVIEGTEYYPYHYNGVGHGIGRFVHEMPFLGPRYNYTIQENTVITIEPGIYIPGWGGVRIEDQLLVTKDGCENMVDATKELIEL